MFRDISLAFVYNRGANLFFFLQTDHIEIYYDMTE
jgi:hypothetical protein